MSKAVKSVSKVVGKVFKPIAKFLAPSISMPSGSDQSANLTQTIRSGKEPAHYLYGRTATGGMLAWAQEEAGEQEERERLDLIYVLAQGEIDGIEQVYVDGEPASTFGDLVQWELHVNRTTPDPYMLSHSSDWRDDMIGRGLSYVRVSLQYDPERFASGIPSLLFVVRGSRTIYDPRTETYGYSDNAVLCTLDYVRNHIGVPDDRIIWDEWRDAANIADEQVTVPGGGTQKRYAIGGAIKSDEAWPSAMGSLEECFAGACRRQAGYWGVRVGAYYGPAQHTITPDMIIGPVTGRTEVSRSEAINSVTGTFRSPDHLWEETSYPTVTVDEWVIEDGGENSESSNYPLVPDAYQCQRLANIDLRSRRAGGMLNLQLNHAGYLLRPGTVVRCDIPHINASGEFRVINWSQGAKQGCTVVIRQEHADIYDDAVGQPFDPGSFINLPTGGIGSPTGLRYVVESVGEVVQGMLLWNPVDAALHYNIVIKRDGQAAQSAQVPAGVERCEIGGLVSGDYTAEVRARGRLGLSGPATITFGINAPPMPERVSLQIGNREITLIPHIAPGASLNGGHYRYYFTTEPSYTQAQSELLGEGLTFTHTGLAPLQTYYYYVQSVNAYGSSPFLRVEVETTLDFDEEFAWLDEQLRKPGGIVDQFENEVNQLGETVESVSNAVDSAQQAASEALQEAQAAVEAASNAEGGAATALAEAQEALDTARNAEAGITDAKETADDARQRASDAQQSASDAIARAQKALTNIDLVSLQQQIDTSTLQAQIALANAVMDVEHSVRVGAEFALSERIVSMRAEFDTAAASLSERITLLASTTQSIAESVAILRTEFDDTSAEFEQQVTLLSDTVQSVGESVTSLRTDFDSSIASINQTLATLSNETQALATANQELRTEFEGNAASVSSELTSLSDEQQALAEATESLRSEVDGNASEISTNRQTLALNEIAQAIYKATMQTQNALGNSILDVENVVRVDAEQSLSQRIIELKATFNDNSATVQQRLTALTDANQALSESLALLRTEYDDSTSEFAQNITVLSNQTQAIGESLTALSTAFDTSTADFEQRITLLSDETQALATTTSTLQSSLDDANARITAEETTRATETQALATANQELRTDFDDNSASVNNDLAALSDGQQAIVTDVNEYKTEANGRLASAESSITVLSSETQALAGAASQLESALDNANARITTEETTRATETDALATANQALRTEFEDNAASVGSSLAALTDEQQSIAQNVSSLETEFEDNKSSVNTTLLSLSNAQSATAGRLDDYEVEVNGELASVRQEVSAVYDPNTGAVAQAVTTVNVGGVRGVIGIQVQGEQAQIIGIANQFAILNPVNDELVTAFVVSDGRVVIPDALVRNASITNAKIANGAINNAKIENASINTAKIENAAITTAKIGVAEVDTLRIAGEAVSATFVANTAGQFQRQILFGDDSPWYTVQELDVDSSGSPHDLLFSVRVRTDSTNNDGTATGAPQVRLLRNGSAFFTLTTLTPSPDANTNLWDLPVVVPSTINMGAGTHTLTLQVRASANMAWSGNGLTPRVLLTAGSRYIRSLELKR
ncbi:phage tail tip fiber protein [Vreelandella venusta]|uniref:phage tail tip protein J-related protein n=1 Tax=Vreelandella venusta TaxID=44935 RepID=UPI003AA9D8DF